jgi:hypothetical protein
MLLYIHIYIFFICSYIIIKPWTKPKATQIDHKRKEGVIDHIKLNVFQILYVRKYRYTNIKRQILTGRMNLICPRGAENNYYSGVKNGCKLACRLCLTKWLILSEWHARTPLLTLIPVTNIGTKSPRDTILSHSYTDQIHNLPKIHPTLILTWSSWHYKWVLSIEVF